MSLTFPIMGILLGMISIVGVMHLFQYIEPRISKFWCRSPRGNDDQSFRRRISWALSPKKWTMFVPLFFGLLNPVYLLLLLGSPVNELAMYCFAGFIVTGLIEYPIYLRSSLAKFRQKLASYAVRKLVKTGDNDFAERLLLAAAQSSEPVMRIVATEGLRELGTPAGNAALDKLCSDKDMDVSLAACHANNSLMRVLSGKHFLSVASLENLIQEYEQVRSYVDRSSPDFVLENRKRVAKCEQEINQIVYSQLLLRRAFPDVYCQKCHSFGEMKAFEDWRWVQCTVCRDAVDLQGEIAVAVGQIGGEHPWHKEDRELKVSLWDTETKRVIPAEINHLQIIGGKEIDYDWAMSAVLEMLRNRQNAHSKPIHLHLLNSPPLSTNTQNLIRDFGFLRVSEL